MRVWEVWWRVLVRRSQGEDGGGCFDGDGGWATVGAFWMFLSLMSSGFPSEDSVTMMGSSSWFASASSGGPPTALQSRCGW